MTLDNHEISGRQCRRSLLVELFGISVFLMTASMANIYGENAFQMLLFGGGLTILLAFYYWHFGKCNGTSYEDQLREAFPHLGILISFLYVLRFSLRAGFLISLFYTLLDQYLIKESNFSYVVIPLILVAAYGALQGREKRLRTMEMLTWFVFVPFLFALLCMAKDVEISHLQESAVMEANWFEMAQGMFIPVALFSNVEFILFLQPKIRKKDQGVKNIIWPVVGALASNFVLLFIVVGILGYSNCSTIKQPVIRVLESINVPGSFVRRLDIFVLAFWIFAVFGVVSGCIFYSMRMIQANWRFAQNAYFASTMEIHWGKNGKIKCPWTLFLVALIVYLMSIKCHSVKDAFSLYLNYSIYLDIPLGMFFAWLIRWKYNKKQWIDQSEKKIKRKSQKKYAALVLSLFIITSLCSGCVKMTNIEDWDYVLTLGIDKEGYTFDLSTKKTAKAEYVKADSLKEAIKTYEKTHSRSLQLGHVSAIIFGEDWLMSKEDYNLWTKVLLELNEYSEIPINTSVYAVYGTAKEVLSQGPYDQKTLGEYMEKLYGTNRKNERENLALQILMEAVTKKDTYTITAITADNKKVEAVAHHQINFAKTSR